MEIYNSTPFTYLPFQSLDAHGAEHYTMVIRGAFKISPNGSLILLDKNTEEAKQEIILADTYYGDTATSSLHWPTDLVYFKPNSDIHIIGARAYSPKKVQLPSWEVGVTVGTLSASLEVHGSRGWSFHKEKNEWRLTQSIPCNEIELKYEFAYGGTWDNGSFFDLNPIGRGCGGHENKEGVTILAPHITAVGEKPSKFGELTTPIGFAPLPPSWPQRLQYAGTYDEDWEQEQHPLPPRDFKYDFYNSAHPDLIYPGYLNGGEKVVLHGFDPEEQITFKIPEYCLEVELIEKSGFGRKVPAVLDTLQIEIESKRVYLVWRIFVPYRQGFLGANIELGENITNAINEEG